MKKLNIDTKKLCEMYCAQRMTTYQIADIFGCSNTAISRKLKQSGVPIRGRKEFMVDDTVFKKWSPDMAYVLGYITADGCIRKNTLSIKSIDCELLDFVKTSLKSNHKITYDEIRGIYSLSIYSKKICDDLSVYGVVPRKSMIIDLPQIPDSLFWDFLCGLIDGDGHIRRSQDDSRQIGFGITGSIALIRSLNLALAQKVGCPIYTHNKAGKARVFTVNGVYAYNILKKCYQTQRYSLNRKKQIAIKAIEQYEKMIHCKCCNGEIEYDATKRRYCKKCSEDRRRQYNIQYCRMWRRGLMEKRS